LPGWANPAGLTLTPEQASPVRVNLNSAWAHHADDVSGGGGDVDVERPVRARLLPARGGREGVGAAHHADDVSDGGGDVDVERPVRALLLPARDEREGVRAAHQADGVGKGGGDVDVERPLRATRRLPRAG